MQKWARAVLCVSIAASWLAAALASVAKVPTYLTLTEASWFFSLLAARGKIAVLSWLSTLIGTALIGWEFWRKPNPRLAVLSAPLAGLSIWMPLQFLATGSLPVALSQRIYWVLCALTSGIVAIDSLKNFSPPKSTMKKQFSSSRFFPIFPALILAFIYGALSVAWAIHAPFEILKRTAWIGALILGGTSASLWLGILFVPLAIGQSILGGHRITKLFGVLLVCVWIFWTLEGPLQLQLNYLSLNGALLSFKFAVLILAGTYAGQFYRTRTLAILTLIFALWNPDPLNDWLGAAARTRELGIFSCSLGTVLSLIPRQLNSRRWAFCLLLITAQALGFNLITRNSRSATSAAFERSQLARAQSSVFRNWLQAASTEPPYLLANALKLGPPRRLQAPLHPLSINVIVIVIDALRADGFHSQGNPRNTSPILDRLLLNDEFYRFDQAYTQFNLTNSSVPTLITASFVPRTGQGSNWADELRNRNFLLQWARLTPQARLLGPPAGYGLTYLFEDPLTQHALWDIDAKTTGADILRAYEGKITQLAPGTPFGAYIHLFDVHHERFKKPGFTDFGNRPRDLYDQNIVFLDQKISDFFKFLKARGIYDKTLIVLTSDHGEQFLENGWLGHGYSPSEVELHIPLWIRIPGKRGTPLGRSILHSEVLPLAFEQLGYSVSGRAPLKIEDFVSADQPSFNAYSMFREVTAHRRGNFKKTYAHETKTWRFYNLESDPHENYNLIDEAKTENLRDIDWTP